MWGIADRYEPQPGEVELEAAFAQNRTLANRLIALRRLDKVYSDLEALVVRLGDLRDERKNIVFFSDYLASPRSNFSDLAIDPLGRTGAPPPVGVSSEGQLTLGPRSGEPDRRWAETERARLTSIDFAQRFRDLLRSARQANVSFYTVRPGGLDPNYSMLSDGISNLHVLAEQTDGHAVAASNDIRPGLKKVTDDLSSHYVLGYYSSNTTWNGASRQITVKLKIDRRKAPRTQRVPRTDRSGNGLPEQRDGQWSGHNRSGKCRRDRAGRARTATSGGTDERLRRRDRERRRPSSPKWPPPRSRAGGGSRERTSK